MIKPTTIALIAALSANGATSATSATSAPSSNDVAAALTAVIIGFAIFISLILYLERNDR